MLYKLNLKNDPNLYILLIFFSNIYSNLKEKYVKKDNNWYVLYI